jgi:NAD(P)-dependent dehydrogenase (short-subunit alcohol dehydrogenase family)
VPARSESEPACSPGCAELLLLGGVLPRRVVSLRCCGRAAEEADLDLADEPVAEFGTLDDLDLATNAVCRSGGSPSTRRVIANERLWCTTRNVTREEDIVGAIARCREEFGGFDLIHNNAGIQIEQRLNETTNEQWEAVNNVNLRGVFWGCKHAVIAMRETGGGSIVNTASILAVTGDPFLPA